MRIQQRNGVSTNFPRRSVSNDAMLFAEVRPLPGLTGQKLHQSARPSYSGTHSLSVAVQPQCAAHNFGSSARSSFRSANNRAFFIQQTFTGYFANEPRYRTSGLRTVPPCPRHIVHMFPPLGQWPLLFGRVFEA